MSEASQNFSGLGEARQNFAGDPQAANRHFAAIVVPRLTAERDEARDTASHYEDIASELRAELADLRAERDSLTGRVAELLADVNRLTAERDRHADDFHFERKQVVALRQVLTEVFTCLNTADMSLLEADQIDEWRERAGLEG